MGEGSFYFFVILNEKLHYHKKEYLFASNHHWEILCEITQGGHHPDSDLSIIRYIGLFCPRMKLVKVKRLYSQSFLKYAPRKMIGGFRVLS